MITIQRILFLTINFFIIQTYSHSQLLSPSNSQIFNGLQTRPIHLVKISSLLFSSSSPLPSSSSPSYSYSSSPSQSFSLSQKRSSKYSLTNLAKTSINDHRANMINYSAAYSSGLFNNKLLPALPMEIYEQSQYKGIPMTSRSIKTTIFKSKSNKKIIKKLPGIPGRPWIDYPLWDKIETTFSCSNSGYFSDPELGCQAWHFCQNDRKMSSFLCPNGTLFNAPTRICDWWYNVSCDNDKTVSYSNIVSAFQSRRLAPYEINFNFTR